MGSALAGVACLILLVGFVFLVIGVSVGGGYEVVRGWALVAHGAFPWHCGVAWMTLGSSAYLLAVAGLMWLAYGEKS